MTATLALLLMPGPAVLYIIARSMRQGRMAGFVSALGIGLAAVVHILFAAFGLSALLMRSAVAFGVVKYLGAVYLIYLGIKRIVYKSERIWMILKTINFDILLIPITLPSHFTIIEIYHLGSIIY